MKPACVSECSPTISRATLDEFPNDVDCVENFRVACSSSLRSLINLSLLARRQPRVETMANIAERVIGFRFPHFHTSFHSLSLRPAGLFLLFIGVGVQVTPTRTVGLLFIALGAFLCFLKVVTTPEEPRRAPIRRHRLLGSNDSLYNLAVPGTYKK